MKKTVIIILSMLPLMCLNGQQLAIDQAKKAITGLTMTVNSYDQAFSKLKPALEDSVTSRRAETWALANRIKTEQFDKYMDNRRVGKKVNVKTMGHTLLDAYDYGMTALQLDTVRIVDKKGNPVMDKKTKNPKFKTKFSKEVVNRLATHLDDYRIVGSELYNVKDWDGAYRAWDHYCTLAMRTDDRRWARPDSLVAEARYYQGIAAWQKNDTIDAVRLFSVARHSGYDHKEAYDYALVCLNDLGLEDQVVKLAWEAYIKFGTSDPQYIRILINSFLAREDFSGANDLIDEAIEANPNDDELQNLKGMIVESQESIYEALPYYQRCIELNDSNAIGQYNVGRYFYNKAMETRKNSQLYGKKLANLINPIYREALPYFEKAYALNYRSDELVNALRDIYYKLGDAQKLQTIESAR